MIRFERPLVGFGDVEDDYEKEEQSFPHVLKREVVIPQLPVW